MRAVRRWRYNPRVVDGEADSRPGVRVLLRFDIPFWCFATIVALWLMRRNNEIGENDRKEGILLITLFFLLARKKK